MTETASTLDPAVLRAAMTGQLRDLGAFTAGGSAVETAVAAVPRHLFAPGASLEAAYAADNPITTKRDAAGAALSSVSAALLQAVMLGQAAIEPGMRVLEVGSGGYNAALIREITGGSGHVTTVDIDPEITARARACLDTAGYDDVEVVLADADTGVPENAPYDRIIVTAGTWDLPPAWLEQLTPDGCIVVPLRFKGLTRSIAFSRDCDNRILVSRSYGLARFVPMQGAGSHREAFLPVADGVTLLTDDSRRQVDTAALHEAILSPGIERWSGAAYDLPDELELFLVSSGPQVMLLFAQQALIDRGIFPPSTARGVPAMVSGGSIAYRTRRATGLDGEFESGVIAHGPAAEQLADQYTGLLRQWAARYRRRGAALIRYYPVAALPAGPPPQFMVKGHGAVEVCWP